MHPPPPAAAPTSTSTASPTHRAGQVLLGLASASSSGANAAALRAGVPRETVVGLFRDLRGIAAATNSRRTYAMLFDWLYPAHFPVLMACLEAWADTPEVTTALLKFVAEFVLNKTQRLTFDSSSPNGILLFREVSKVGAGGAVGWRGGGGVGWVGLGGWGGVGGMGGVGWGGASGFVGQEIGGGQWYRHEGGGGQWFHQAAASWAPASCGHAQ